MANLSQKKITTPHLYSMGGQRIMNSQKLWNQRFLTPMMICEN
jgi:hypothetical protein